MINSLNQKFIQGRINSEKSRREEKFPEWDEEREIPYPEEDKFPESEIPWIRNSLNQKFLESEIPCRRNFWFREFFIQGISQLGNFSSCRSGHFSVPYRLMISGNLYTYMNFTFPPGREFLLPASPSGSFLFEFILHGSSPPLRAGNLSFREFLIQGIYHSENLSFRESFVIYVSLNVSYREFTTGNFSLREFLIKEFLIQGISPPLYEFLLPYMNFWFREFLIQGISH